MSNLIPYTKQWLETLCAESYSLAQVLAKAGRKPAGGNYVTLKKKIQEFNIDTSHFTGQLWNKGKTKETDSRIAAATVNKEKYTLDEILIKNSPVAQKVLRGYIERHQVLEYKCQKCGCDGHWQDGIISLEIDHINGDNTDNRIENLHYLCPNCHALTDTYRGKNKALKNIQK